MTFNPDGSVSNADVTLYASASSEYVYVAEDAKVAQAAREHALREREYGAIMRQRHGVCG